MLLRPDAGDEVEFLDEMPELSAAVLDAPDGPSLAEQRAHRRYHRGRVAEVRREAA